MENRRCSCKRTRVRPGAAGQFDCIKPLCEQMVKSGVWLTITQFASALANLSQVSHGSQPQSLWGIPMGNPYRSCKLNTCCGQFSVGSVVTGPDGLFGDSLQVHLQPQHPYGEHLLQL